MYSSPPPSPSRSSSPLTHPTFEFFLNLKQAKTQYNNKTFQNQEKKTTAKKETNSKQQKPETP